MKIVLAPMEGLVDDIMRDVLTQIGGIDWCVTEFIRVTSSVLPSRTFYRLAPELRHGAKTRSGTPVRIQLLGSDPDFLAANACKAARLGAAAIDLNFGCPAPTVNRHRGGAILLTDTQALSQIVSSVRKAVPSDVLVTAKMRLGYEDTTLTLANAQAIAEAGADELTVHARTKVEGYRPPAHWDWLARIRESVDIPVIANGEVWNTNDYHAIRRISGCDTVMIGRGLVSAPDLALQIKGLAQQPASWHEVRDWVADLAHQCHLRAPDNSYAISRAKQWLKLLRRNHPEADILFNKIKVLNKYDDLRAVFAGSHEVL